MRKNLKLASVLFVGLGILAGCSSDDAVAPAPTISTFTQISTGGRHIYNARVETAHTCGISEGRLWCWGANGDGQLGTGNRVPQSTPTLVGEDTTWTSVSTGGGFTCGINDSKLYCWGSNRVYGKFDYNSTETDPYVFYGLLGLGNSYKTSDSVDTPTQVGTAADWAQISSGMNHVCGIREETATKKTLWCWGFSAFDGSSTDKLGLNGANDFGVNVPTKVGTATNWIAISSGNRGATYGIQGTSSTGTLWHFGEGSGGVSDNDVPTQVGADNDWKIIASGAYNSCGIRKQSSTQNTLWCWGSNRHGEAGQNTANTSVNTITQVGTSTDWESIDMSNGHACGIRNKNLYCWGRNYNYELGLGKDLSSFTSCGSDAHSDDQWDCGKPELVSTDLSWTSVSTGNLANCGLVGEGDLYCWGSNMHGQTGVESATASVVLKPTKLN